MLWFLHQVFAFLKSHKTNSERRQLFAAAVIKKPFSPDTVKVFCPIVHKHSLVHTCTLK